MARAARWRRLRPATRAIYANAIDTHLRPRWGRTRLDAISGDDVAALVRDLRADGAAEWSIRGIVGALGRVYRHASTAPRMARDESDHAAQPRESDRGRARQSGGGSTRATNSRRRSRRPAEPTRTLFALAAVTGARLVRAARADLGRSRPQRPRRVVVRIEAQVDRFGRPPAAEDGREPTHHRDPAEPRGRAQAPPARERRAVRARPSCSRRDRAARSVSGTSYERSGTRRRAPWTPTADRPSPRWSMRWKLVRRSRATPHRTSTASGIAPRAWLSPTGRAPRRWHGNSATRTRS